MPRARIHLRQPSGGELHLHGLVTATAREGALMLTRFDVSGARVRWASEPVLAPGVWTGRLSLAQNGDRLSTDAALSDTDTTRIDQAIQARGGRKPTPWTVHYGDG